MLVVAEHANFLQYKLVLKISEPGCCESLFLEINNGVKLLFGVVYLPNGDLSSFENSHLDLFQHCNCW